MDCVNCVSGLRYGISVTKMLYKSCLPHRNGISYLKDNVIISMDFQLFFCQERGSAMDHMGQRYEPDNQLIIRLKSLMIIIINLLSWTHFRV